VAALAESPERPDVVVLCVPRDRRNLPIIRVVIGGVASRSRLSVDQLDDLILAVETLFSEETLDRGDFCLAVSLAGNTFAVTLAGLESPLVYKALSHAADDDADSLAAHRILRVIMDALVDEYLTMEGPAGSFAVEMRKRVL
jgi:hypothetical protein